MSMYRADDGTGIYYEDVGAGPPLVFVHGWPLSGAMWEYQIVPLIEAGFRCITRGPPRLRTIRQAGWRL